jgi:hypothetical protein
LTLRAALSALALLAGLSALALLTISFAGI